MPAASPDPRSDLARLSLNRVARIALLSVALGFLMQGLVLALTLWGRGGGGAGGSALAAAAGGVTWSVLVCTGLGIATVLAKGRPLLNGALAAALAPLSLAVAKGSQKVVAGWIGDAKSQAVLALGTVSLLRAVEYAVLGWLLGRIVAAGRERAGPFLGAGALVGGLFGGAITWLTWRAAAVAGEPLTQARLASTVVNECLFPIGCALVIHLGVQVGRSLRLAGLASDAPQPSS